MLKAILLWLRSLLFDAPILLAIVRRYEDAKGNYVGELYVEDYDKVRNIATYNMIGVSLDSFPLNIDRIDIGEMCYALELNKDFLAAMLPNRLRVGAMDPKDNDAVRRMVGCFPRSRITVTIRNGFRCVMADRRCV